MKRKICKFLMLLHMSMLSFISCSEKLPDTELIRINSLGYKPEGSKQATIITDSCKVFYLRSVVNNKQVYEGKLSTVLYQKDVEQNACVADFSDYNEQGEYYVEVPGIGSSKTFSINNDVYTEAFKIAFRAFYLLRCGTEVEAVFNKDTFYHAPCHMEDGWLTFTEFGNVQKDGSGGWHDAGDYGKYTVNAGITLGNLFLAWQHFGEKFKHIDFELPETAPAFPQFLKELKWETDFLLKMQYGDGSGRVSHKLTGTHFRGFIRAENDIEKRYFSDWSTDAIANFTSVMAMAARFFRPYDNLYADKCLNAALESYSFLEKNLEDKPWKQKEFHTGEYRANDKYARLWAAAELWETTGGSKFLADFENRAEQFENKIDMNWDWGNVKNLGMFTYVLSRREGKDKTLTDEIKKAVLDNADAILKHINTDIYGRPFEKYHWGCNGTVARLSLNLSVANLLNQESRYGHGAQQIVAHLFGRNYYGRSYVTGLGINPPMLPHDRRSASDDIVAPWPGYIIGGGHTATDWVDEEESFSHNEIAINWQAALVYLLAWFAE